MPRTCVKHITSYGISVSRDFSFVTDIEFQSHVNTRYVDSCWVREGGGEVGLECDLLRPFSDRLRTDFGQIRFDYVLVIGVSRRNYWLILYVYARIWTTIWWRHDRYVRYFYYPPLPPGAPFNSRSVCFALFAHSFFFFPRFFTLNFYLYLLSEAAEKRQNAKNVNNTDEFYEERKNINAHNSNAGIN